MKTESDSPNPGNPAKPESKSAATIGAVSAIVAGLFTAGINFWADDDDGNNAGRDHRTPWYAANDGFFDRRHATQVVSLEKQWSISFAKEDLSGIEVDASDWQVIDGDDSWEEQGMAGFDGHAWYRKSFAWNEESDTSLYLVLGRVDDADVTYINGRLIGRTGTMERGSSAWDSPRTYFIPPGLLRTDAPNVLAVHVFDQGGAGGLVGEEMGIYRSALPVPLVDLAGDWEITADEELNGDGPTDDADQWENVVAPGHWDVQGWRDFDGNAWYRKHFTLAPIDQSTAMELSLGRIDDRDEVYLNGELIGKTWRDTKDQKQWNELRRYEFSSALLREGEDANELLVKVGDVRMSGGIHAGPLGIMTKEMADRYWEIRHAKKPALQTFWDWLLGRK